MVKKVPCTLVVMMLKKEKCQNENSFAYAVIGPLHASLWLFLLKPPI
jgi:hypothetical protein